MLDRDTTALPPIVLSRYDRDRLEALLEKVGGRRDLDVLRDEIDRADVVEPEKVPADRVTMNSRVRFLDEASREEEEVTLVFPGRADTAARCVSVLAPVGSALLGLSVGDSIEWPLPNARTRRLRVVSISYQPEAAGDPG